MSHSGMSKGTAKEYFKSLKTEQDGVPCTCMELKREYRVKLKEEKKMVDKSIAKRKFQFEHKQGN